MAAWVFPILLITIAMVFLVIPPVIVGLVFLIKSKKNKKTKK